MSETEKGIVYCEGVLSYTVYKVRDEFDSIRVLFDKETASLDDTKIVYDNGEETIKPSRIKKKVIKTSGITQWEYVFEIPETLKQYDHLTIRRKMYEPGHDHWISYNWQSLTPYENLSCNIKCFDGLTIKEYMVFDNKSYYHIERSDDQTSLNISSPQWLEADTGFYAIISDT